MEIDIEQKVAMAQDLFKQGYNCSQSVAMAYADIVGLDKELLERMALPFGGGFGRQREICGTVCGAGIIIGLTMPSVGKDSHTDKARAYELVQNFSQRFREINGSIICRELLALGKGEQCNSEPSQRTAEYYRRRPCAEYVAESARIIGQMLSE